MTDLERIARANLAAAEVQAAIFDYFHMYLCGRDQLSAIAERIILAAMPEIAAMREEIEIAWWCQESWENEAETCKGERDADRDAMREEIERQREQIAKYLAECSRLLTAFIDRGREVEAAEADRDHWKAECERLREQIVEMNDEFREISDRADARDVD